MQRGGRKRTHKAPLTPLHGRLQRRRAPPGQRGNGARARARARPHPTRPAYRRRGARFPLPLAADQSEGAEAVRGRGSRGGAWRRRRRRGGGEPYNGGRVEAAR